MLAGPGTGFTTHWLPPVMFQLLARISKSSEFTEPSWLKSPSVTS